MSGVLLIKKNNHAIRDILLIYLLVGFSVIPFFTQFPETLFYTTICFFAYARMKHIIIFDKNSRVIFILLIIMYLGQSATLGPNVMNVRSVLGTFVRFLFPLLVIRIVNRNFIKLFPKVIYVLSIISLAFWIGEHFYSQITDFIHQMSKNYNLDIESNDNILVYNAEETRLYGIIRNAGFAYEGGGYSIVLIIALIINLIEDGPKLTRRNIILAFSVVSTLSTAGIFALVILLYGYIIKTLKNKYILTLVSVLFTILFVKTYQSLDFMQEKIQGQIELAQDPDETRGRFASAMADIRTWQTHPVFGVGKFDETRYAALLEGTSKHRVNGLAAFLAVFGIIVFVGYLALMYTSLSVINKAYNNKKIIVVFQFLSLVLLAFAQICMQWPIFIMLLFLSSINIPYKENEKNINPIPK